MNNCPTCGAAHKNDLFAPIDYRVMVNEVLRADKQYNVILRRAHDVADNHPQRQVSVEEAIWFSYVAARELAEKHAREEREELEGVISDLQEKMETLQSELEEFTDETGWVSGQLSLPGILESLQTALDR